MKKILQLFLVSIFICTMQSCGDEIIHHEEKYEIINSPSPIKAQNRKPPHIRVLLDTGYYDMNLNAYYPNQQAKLVGRKIEKVKIIENEKQDLQITFYGENISETIHFNLKEATVSHKKSGFYEFKKYNRLHGKYISEKRALLEFNIGLGILLFLCFLSIYYVIKHKKSNWRRAGCQIVLISGFIIFITFCFIVAFFFIVFQDVRPGL